MDFVIEYWYIVVAAVAVVAIAGVAVYRFAGLPTERQLKKVQEWLLYAVTMAEKELGSGTGRLKLRYVYDWFLQTFPWLAKLISFELFSSMVDDVLEEMRKMLDSNVAVSAYVWDDKREVSA